MTGSFESLIALARSGSTDALSELFASCRDYLLMVANGEVADDLRPKAAPSDLVQQTLMEAYQGFERFEGASEGELYLWLRRILLNNVNDVTRGFRQTARRDIDREVRLVDDDSQGAFRQGLVADGTSPSARAVKSEEQVLLAKALARLPPHYAEAIRLRNLEFRSFAEVGEALQISADSARKLWERAVRKLTRELNPIHDSV